MTLHRIAILLLLLLTTILHIRVMQLEHRISYLADELIQTKKDVLQTDQMIGKFMSSTNDFMHTANEITKMHSKAILQLAGAR